MTWDSQLLDYLPDNLRPDRRDDRFALVADALQRAGWSPWQAAAQVVGKPFGDTIHNPRGLVLRRLEDLAQRGPDDASPAHERACQIPGCYQGWLDHLDANVTTPCPACRPELAHRIANIPAPGKRTQRHHDYLRFDRTAATRKAAAM